MSSLAFTRVVQMSFGDDTFSAVIDKGTLDALLPPGPSLQQVDAVQRMFREVQRVLKVGEAKFNGSLMLRSFTRPAFFQLGAT